MYAWTGRQRFNHTHMHVHVFAAWHAHMHTCVPAENRRIEHTHFLPSFSSSVPRKGLHASHHSNTAPDSSGGIACLVVAVVSVIQEQLLRCPWTQTSFLPGACLWQTQAWRVSFPPARRERPFTPRSRGSSTRHTPAPAQITNLGRKNTWTAAFHLNRQDRKHWSSD